MTMNCAEMYNMNYDRNVPYVRLKSQFNYWLRRKYNNNNINNTNEEKQEEKEKQLIIDLKFKMNSSSKFCGPSIICRAAVSWRIRKSATGGGISFRRSGRICNLGERRFSGRRRLRTTTIDATAGWPWANVMLLSRRGGTDRQAPARPPTAPCMGGLDDVAWQWSVLTGRRSIIQWHRPINGRSKDLDKRTEKAAGKSSLYDCL